MFVAQPVPTTSVKAIAANGINMRRMRDLQVE
jgi:hypothetical protein